MSAQPTIPPPSNEQAKFYAEIIELEARKNFWNALTQLVVQVTELVDKEKTKL
jgi:hypothetical protein